MLNGKVTLFFVLACLVLGGCMVDPEHQGAYMENYRKFLRETDTHVIPPPPPGSEVEKHAIETFRLFYEVFSEERIRRSIKTLYAPDAYFRDGFREVQGIEAITAYFISSTDAVSSCTFDIQDVAVHDGNYYFRWIMHLTLKRNKEKPIQAVGMSHVRFNAQGQIIFHQDYWDTGIIYEQAPILGRIITWIRSRI
ncbi:SnoaL-like domain-containing protein [Syntrophus gentianae]|uniref:SnoaL-like domain-containing protein n=1 Tax=Syntrophus gentianae TaxID=43775 RepID=A0A1H7YES2_9BACT|nr:nuclear transport factor 2 family protein [Syntrophus gentianae]SEM44712.1 SnoaL-like domain-containing protein [Syntrophus gentianae]